MSRFVIVPKRNVPYKRLLKEYQLCQDAGFRFRKRKYCELFTNANFYDRSYQILDYSWKRQTRCKKQWQKRQRK